MRYYLICFLVLFGVRQSLADPWTGGEKFNPWLFEQRVSRAVHQLSLILDEERNIQLAEHEDHTYDDKFTVVQSVVTATLQSMRSMLTRLGVTEEMLKSSSSGESLEDDKDDDGKKCSLSGRIFFNFQKTTQCKFLESKEAKVRTKGNNQKVLGVSVTSESYDVVTEHHWSIEESYELSVRRADTKSSNDDEELLQGNTISSQTNMSSLFPVSGRAMKTSTKTTVKQKPVSRQSDVPEIELTWLFQEFSLNRTRAATPRRNEEVEHVLEQMHKLHSWMDEVLRRIFHIYVPPDQDRPNHEYHDDSDPILILPWMDTNSTHLTNDDWQMLLRHQLEGLDQRLKTIEKTHEPGHEALFWSVDEGRLATIMTAMAQTLRLSRMSIMYIEHLLQKQLVEALGKEITPKDFDSYMKHFNRQWLEPEFAPKPFSHAIRPSMDQNPAGIISIESQNEAESLPIETLYRRISPHDQGGVEEGGIHIPLDASSRVKLTGDRYLHGWLRHTFAAVSGVGPIHLKARARQFSSFVLLVGTMTSADTMDAKHAIILSNKDQVLIPILTETLPSAKQFRDAITSLSPEQQEFAKAFRAMQLESSVFAIAVVQLKPQLETVLSLPKGSLNKEIQLTEDLITLFVEYQIPSDLVSYDGDDSASASQRIQVVKEYVASVLGVIQSQKEEELKEEKLKAENRKARQEKETERIVPMMMDEMSANSHAASRRTQRRQVKVALSEAMMDERVQASPMVAEDAAYSNSRHFSMTDELGYVSDMPAPLAMPSSASSTASTTRDSLRSRTKEERNKESAAESGRSSKGGISNDFTMIPRLLDAKMEKLDKDGALTSTILKTGKAWTLLRKDNLLLPQKRMILGDGDSGGGVNSIMIERNKAMDLLDALSKSGAIPLEKSEVHVIISLSHRFEESVMATLVERNINPIPRVQLSTLLMGSTIHGKPALELVQKDQDVNKFQVMMPELFLLPSSSEALETDHKESI